MAGTLTSQQVDTPRAPRPALRRGLLIFVLLLAIELLVVAGVAAWVALGARSELQQARRDAAAGRQAAEALDIRTAEASFADAQEHFERAAAELRNPAVRALTVMPVIGDDLRTAQTLAASGGIVAEAATDILAFINRQPDGARSLLPSNGRFPVRRLAALAATADDAAQRLADADATVAATPDDGLFRPVAQARAEFSDELTQARSLVESAAGVSGALAVFMGDDGPRRYLFGAQNPSELRGTGGFIGAYAVATFDRGRFDLSRFVPVQQLTSLPISDVPPPSADFAARYNRYGGAGFWQAINASPDFPSAAQAMVELYGRTEDVNLDGVIVVDPFALEALLRLVGEVWIPGFGDVGPDEVVPVVSIEAREQFSTGDARKEILGVVAASALQKLLAGDGSPGPHALLDTLAPVLEHRHLLLYSTDPSVQATLDRLGFTGALPEPDHDTMAVAVNNAAVNKVDFFVDRIVDYRVRLRSDGSATGRLRVTFDNRAPVDGFGDALGPNLDDLEVGDNRSLVSVFCGHCEPTRARPPLTDADVRSGMVLERERGHTVATTLLTVPRASKRSITLRWRVEDAWSPEGDGCYDVTYNAQPTIRATKLRVTVVPPDGYRPREAGNDAAGNDVLHTGAVEGVWHGRTCYEPSDRA